MQSFHELLNFFIKQRNLNEQLLDAWEIYKNFTAKYSFLPLPLQTFLEKHKENGDLWVIVEELCKDQMQKILFLEKTTV